MLKPCRRTPKQTLRRPAILCLICSLLSLAAPAIGESADEGALGSQPPDEALTASQQDSENDESIVVELDIPPELAAFLEEQETVPQGSPPTPGEDGDITGTAEVPAEEDIESDSPVGAQSEPATADSLQGLPYRGCFAEAAETYQIEELLLVGIAIVESSLDPDAISSSDALGLMQIKWPITANHLGIQDRQALFDPCTNIDAGARYLRELLDDLSSFGPEPRMRLALASYRLGPNGFDPNMPLPAIAQDYIARIETQQNRLGAPAGSPVKASVSGPVLPCLLQNLRQLAAITHDPGERNAQFGNWLNARGQGCSTLALIQIRNNMPTWLGTSLTQELESQVEDLLASSIDAPERETSRRNTSR